MRQAKHLNQNSCGNAVSFHRFGGWGQHFCRFGHPPIVGRLLNKAESHLMALRIAGQAGAQDHESSTAEENEDQADHQKQGVLCSLVQKFQDYSNLSSF